MVFQANFWCIFSNSIVQFDCIDKNSPLGIWYLKCESLFDARMEMYLNYFVSKHRDTSNQMIPETTSSSVNIRQFHTMT